jgi:predicted nucleic acid-binding Zn ribbon protein
VPAERSGGEGRPSSIGAVIREVLGDRRLRGGVSLGRLVRSWEAVVGLPLGRVTAPARLEGGTLVVVAESNAWAAQVSFLAEDLRRRANEAIGSELVRSVRVTVVRQGRKPLRRSASGGLEHGPETPGSAPSR